MSLKKEIQTDYPLIPMSEIDEEARIVAVKWCEAFMPGMAIQEKHKLASDFMNYARRKNQKK